MWVVLENFLYGEVWFHVLDKVNVFSACTKSVFEYYVIGKVCVVGMSGDDGLKLAYSLSNCCWLVVFKHYCGNGKIGKVFVGFLFIEEEVGDTRTIEGLDV